MVVVVVVVVSGTVLTAIDAVVVGTKVVVAGTPTPTTAVGAMPIVFGGRKTGCVVVAGRKGIVDGKKVVVAGKIGLVTGTMVVGVTPVAATNVVVVVGTKVVVVAGNSAAAVAVGGIELNAGTGVGAVRLMTGVAAKLV